MKRVVKLFSFVLFLMLFFVPESVSAKAAIRMYEPDTMMLVETTKQLSLVKATSATSYKEIKKGITWASNNEGVATVDEKGIVTSISVGKATITATYKDEDYVTNLEVVESATGDTIVRYAELFVGNPYVFAGNSLTFGCDSSGFIHEVYKNFNIEVPRSSFIFRNYGRDVKIKKSALKAGDVIVFQGHVAIYDGNGKILEARGQSWGIMHERTWKSVKKKILSVKRYI